jgi:hypothetical protein
VIELAGAQQLQQTGDVLAVAVALVSKAIAQVVTAFEV